MCGVVSRPAPEDAAVYPALSERAMPVAGEEPDGSRGSSGRLLLSVLRVGSSPALLTVCPGVLMACLSIGWMPPGKNPALM